MSNRASVLGKTVNMDALRLQNENTIAVGNMNVNARGDLLGHGGKVIKTRNELMQEYYQQQKDQLDPDEEF